MTPQWGRVLGAVALSYLAGDILFAYVVGRLIYGVDVRRYGSHNLGGTNVFRTLGLLAAVLVIVGDVGKGALAVWLGGLIAGRKPWVLMLCGIAAIAGHNWPAFLRFQGGRGIGTSLGVLLGLMPAAALVPALTFVVTVALTRYVSLGSILAAVALPFTVYWLHYPGLYLAGSVVLSGFALYRHVPNMKKLVAGKEFKLGEKIAVDKAPKPEGEGAAVPGGEEKA